jgi:heat shock protein HtpX
MNNTFKTTLLLSLLTMLLVVMGGAVGGQGGMIVAFLMAAVMNFGSYWYSDKIVLRMYDAGEITREIHPSFYGMVERLAGRAGLPMPRVYIIGGLASLFSTHPPMEERIARLEALAARTH